MLAIGHTVLNRTKAANTRSAHAVWDAYSHPLLPAAGLAPFDARARDTAMAAARDLLDGTVPGLVRPAPFASAALTVDTMPMPLPGRA